MIDELVLDKIGDLFETVDVEDDSTTSHFVVRCCCDC